MKKLNKALFLSFALMACVNAQAQVVKFPMEMSADATTIESVSNQKFQAQGALAPVSVAGAREMRGDWMAILPVFRLR